MCCAAAGGHAGMWLCPQRAAARGRQLAGDAEHRHRIAAIGRDGDLEQRFIEPEVVAQRCAQRRVGGQFDDALPGFAQSQFARRAQHALRFDAAQVRGLDDCVARQFGADGRQCRAQSCAGIGARRRRSAVQRAAPVVHRAHAQLVGLRCGTALVISATTTPLKGGATGWSDSTSKPSIVRRSASSRSSTARRPRRAAMKWATSCAQPRANCARKRRSFSKNRRRSFTP